LLVEDPALLGDGIPAGLKMSGYAVEWIRDGEAAQAAQGGLLVQLRFG
jgi:DNA-binding response OmpR family regulator